MTGSLSTVQRHLVNQLRVVTLISSEAKRFVKTMRAMVGTKSEHQKRHFIPPRSIANDLDVVAPIAIETKHA